MRVPGCKILISNRPVHGISISRWSFKFKFTPTLGSPCPYQGLATYLVPTNPIKWFLLYVWMLLIFYKKMLGAFIKRVASSNYRILLFYFQWQGSSIVKLPEMFYCYG